MIDGKLKKREFFIATLKGEKHYGFFVNDVPMDLMQTTYEYEDGDFDGNEGYFNHEGITYIKPSDANYKYIGNEKVDGIVDNEFVPEEQDQWDKEEFRMDWNSNEIFDDYSEDSSS